MAHSDGMFTWSPDKGSKGGRSYDVETVGFDSYEQNVSIGINPRIRHWDLRFRRASKTIKQIVDFLDSKRGGPFYFTDPHTGLPVRVKVDGQIAFDFTGSVREGLSFRLIEVKGPIP